MNKNTSLAPSKESATHFPYELSISMIVKNDVTLLEKCLTSLKPLREALDCQLIITDTGSTDGTKELAQAQADLFLEFPWCDDFAKARNVGLERAQGRWLFYVDSDHIFDESYQGIVDFIRSSEGESNQHPYATVMIRNYSGSASNHTLQWNDMISCLLVNFSHKKRFFVGRIHESIPLPAVSVPHIPTVLHHWGYVDGKYLKKSSRNSKILLEVLEENPNDLKQHLQYLRETLPPKDIREHITKVLAVIENPNHKSLPDFSRWSILCLICMGNFYLKIHDYKEAESTVELLNLRLAQDSIFQDTIVALEIYGLAYALSLGKQAPLLELNQCFRNYQQLFYKLKHSPNNAHVIFYDYPHTTERLFYTLELELIKDLAHEGEQTEALSHLQNSLAYQLKNYNGQYQQMKEYLNLALTLDDISLVGVVQNFLKENPSSDNDTLLQSTLEDLLPSLTPEQQQRLWTLLGETPTDSYSALCYFRCHDHQISQCPPSVTALLLESPKRLEEPFLSSLVYGSVKHHTDLALLLPTLPPKALPSLVTKLGDTQPDFFSMVLENLQSDDFTIQSLKEEQFWAHLGYEVLAQLSHMLSKEKLPEVLEEHRSTYTKGIAPAFRAVTGLMKHYIDTVYDPNILSYEGIAVLSSEEHFGFYCAIAVESESSHSLEYIRTLKEAVKITPKYQSLVYFLIAQLQQEDTPTSHTPHKGEFSALAVEVKTNITLFLANGQIDTAKLLLEKYRSIQPDDPELPDLIARCGM